MSGVDIVPLCSMRGMSRRLPALVAAALLVAGGAARPAPAVAVGSDAAAAGQDATRQASSDDGGTGNRTGKPGTEPTGTEPTGASGRTEDQRSAEGRVEDRRVERDDAASGDAGKAEGESSGEDVANEQDGTVAQDGVGGNGDRPDDGSKPAPERAAGSTAEPTATPAPGAWTLPDAAPDGRPFRPIALFASQLAELIPDHYRPVALQQLVDAISASPQLHRDGRRCRMEASYYEVDLRGDTLVSDRSVLQIQCDAEGRLRHHLGAVNFALKPAAPQPMTADQTLPRLETSSGGSLVAVIEGESDIVFGWTLKGESSGVYREFELHLPRCPQTQIELTTPENIVVETLDGVLRQVPPLPKPVPRSSEREARRRYIIDAGGLGTVRLRTRLSDQDRPEKTLLVRRSSLQYEIESSGMTWAARMSVQVPARGSLPSLRIQGGTVTSVEIDGVDVPFTTSAAGEAARRLQLERPGDPGEASAAPMSITISGRATWPGERGWCALPWPVWDCQQVIQASATSEAQLRVFEPLSVLMWQLPAGWTQEVASRLSDTATVLQAQGPPLAAVSEEPAADQPWSRVRLATRSSLQASDSILRLDVETETLQASARIALTVDPDRIEPVPVHVQPGWTLRSLRLPASGRVIEAPSVNPASGAMMIWPVAEDVDGSELVIEASGRAPLSSSEKVTIPSTWFVRVGGVPGDFVTAVVPPAALNWSGETALQGQPIERTELSDAQQIFLRSISDNTLIFRPRTGRTPRLQLQQPSVAMSVSTALHLGRENGQVSERLVIQTDAAAQVPPQLTILTGPSAGRPPYHWSLLGDGDSAPIRLPATDVQVDDREGEGTYTIDLSDHDWRGRELVGRRRYRLVDDLEMRLPSIPKAASQDAEAFLETGLLVRESSPAVLRVPVEDDPASSATRLRYDAVDQPAIVVGTAESNPSVAMVWREDVQWVASSRGTDRIEANYQLTSPQPIRIDYPAGLKLSAIYRNGAPVDLISLSRRPIELPGGSGTETIRIVWNRNQIEPGVVRRCAIPQLDISGIVLKSQRRLIASPDTFVPATLWRGTGAESHLSGHRQMAVSVDTGGSVLLVQRNVALASGWLASLAIFALSWWVARRYPAASAIATVGFAAAALLWLPWATAVVGWLVLPCAAGGLLAASLDWRRDRSEPDWPGITPDDSQSGSARRERSALTAAPTSSWIHGRSARGVVLAAVLASGTGSGGWAQDARQRSDQPAGRTSPIDVLVPVDSQGGRLGDKIYIPETVYQHLFRVPKPDAPQAVHFAEANYQIKLSQQREAAQENAVSVEAVYLLRVDQTATKLRLPISAESIRRVELIQADADRIVRFSGDDGGDTVVAVPPDEEFRLRLTMVPEIQDSDGIRQLRLDVPPVASAQLTVEADRGINGVEITRSTGQISGDDDLRRWVAQIGPIRSLRLRYRPSDRLADVASQPIRRRYWINVGKDQTAVDCEISPAGSVAVGESVELVVLDSELPTVISPAWRLQRTELLSPSRWLVSFVKRTDTASPISLLWSFDSVINDPPTEDPGEIVPPLAPAEAVQSMSVPEVVAAGSEVAAPAWVAIHSDPDLRVAPINAQPSEPLAVDQFLAAWNGYRGRIDRALVVLGQLPPIAVTRRPRVEASVTQQHHLHVTPEELQLRYVAQLNRGDMTSARRTLRLPQDVELLNLTVNGRAVGARPNRAGRFREVALGRLPDRDVVTIEAMVVAPTDADRRFSLPQLHIWPRIATRDTYTLSRDHATRIRELRPPAVEADRNADLDTAEALTEGWVPIATWSSQQAAEAEASQGLGGSFQMIRRPTRFDSRQLIALIWQQGRWSMETSVELLSKPLPDYVDVELPTRWCESLEIEPGTVWSRQPATDPSRQVIRIQCDGQALRNQPISIRGQLESSDKGRLSVPPVDVLGTGRRRVLISVPDRLTNESIQWRTSAVAAIETLPKWAAKMVPDGARSTYSAASAAWSIDLASLPQISAEASATVADFQIFPKNGHSLILARWDLVPGGLDSVAVRLPQEATCLGAWTAGRPVSPRPLGSAGAANGAEAAETPHRPPGEMPGRILRVPLSLSRLSQSVEVLLRVPAAQISRTGYLPQLLDITVNQHWVAHHTAAVGDGAAPIPQTLSADSRRRAKRRYRALAHSIVESVEQSLDLLAERPASEVATWLAPWAARYQDLADAAGHPLDWAAAAGPPELEGRSEEVSAEAKSEQLSASGAGMPAGWGELDRRMAVQVTRFLGSEPEFPPTLFDSDRLDGYGLSSVTAPESADTAPPLPSADSESEELRFLIGRLLTLVMVVGAATILWPLRRRGRHLLVHPALWLAAVALCGFVVAPVPVAIALLVVAVTMPFMPPRRSR